VQRNNTNTPNVPQAQKHWAKLL